VKEVTFKERDEISVAGSFAISALAEMGVNLEEKMQTETETWTDGEKEEGREGREGEEEQFQLPSVTRTKRRRMMKPLATVAEEE
jgi:hypothetical protein